MAAEVAVVIKAKDQTKGVFAGVQNRLGGLAKFGKAAFLGIGAGVAVAGAAITKFTIDAAKVEQSRNTFDKLAQSVGDNLPNALQKMQRATRGMVADQDLFLAGNRFLNMGLAQTTDEAAKLSEMGSQLALAMGGEATQGMEDFALMLANQSLPRLDTFGISSGRVRERILELMAADKSLTREMAFTAAVMEEGSKAMERVGEQGEGAAAEYAKFKTVLTNLKTEVGRAFLPIMTKLLSKVLIPMAKWLAQRLVPWMQKFSKILELFGTRVANRLKPFVGLIQDIVAGFQEWRAYKFEDHLEVLHEIMERLFGSTVASAAYRFLDVLQRIGWAFSDWRAYRFEDHLEELRDILERLFGGRIAGLVYTFANRLWTAFYRIKNAFDTLKGAGVGLWQDHIFPRLKAIATGVQEWWETGGLGRTLTAISTGWTKMVDGLSNFYTDHIGPKLDLVKTWIGIWWSGMGGSQGILTKISEGWAKYIAEPLSNFYEDHLSAKLSNIRARLSGWWSSLAEGDGVMIRLGAMWNKYLALPIKDFWSEHGGKFEALKTALSGWATAIADFVRTRILEPLGLIAPEVEEATVGVKGARDEIDRELGKEAPREGFWDKVRRTLDSVYKTLTDNRFIRGLINIGKSIVRILIAMGKYVTLLDDFFKAVAAIVREKLPTFVELHRQFWELLQNIIPGLGRASGEGSRWGEGLASINDILEGIAGWLDTTRERMEANIQVQGEMRRELETQIRPPPVYIDVYYRYHGTPPGGTPGEPYRPPGSYTPPGETPGLPAYQGGGVVPGPIGVPQLSVLHGGERVLTRDQARRGQGNYYDFRGAIFQGIDEDMVEELFEAAALKRRLQGDRDSF